MQLNKGWKIVYGEKVNGYTKEATITVSARDTGGLADKPYSYDDGKTYTDVNRFTVYENGVYSIRVKDALSNESVRTCEINGIDNQPPSIVITGDSSLQDNGSVTLIIQAADMQCGMASLWYQGEENKNKVLISEYSGERFCKEKLTLTKNGTYSIIAYDALGNRTEEAVKVTKISNKSSSSSSSSQQNSSSSSTYIPPRTSSSSTAVEETKPVVVSAKKSTSSAADPEDKIDREIIVRNPGTVSDNTTIEKTSDDDNETTLEAEEEELGLLDYYEYDKDIIEGSLDKALSAPDNTVSAGFITDNAGGKEEKNKISAGKIIFAGILILIILLLIAVILLWRLGFIDLPIGDRENQEEEYDEDATESTFF